MSTPPSYDPGRIILWLLVIILVVILLIFLLNLLDVGVGAD